jgi:hypothetical protein
MTKGDIFTPELRIQLINIREDRTLQQRKYQYATIGELTPPGKLENFCDP